MTAEMINAFELEAEFYDDIPGRKDHSDVAFYLELARECRGPVLDLACGTGRTAVPCALEAGEAVGVDLAPAMLEKARDKAAKKGVGSAVDFVHGNMCDIRLDRRFPLVIVGGQSLFFLATDEELRATLETVRIHLAAGGHWAGDVPVLRHSAMLEMQNRMHFVGEVRRPDTGRRAAIWDYTSVDEVGQVAKRRRITEILDDSGLVLERRHSEQTLYYRHPMELRRVIQDAGFCFEGIYGGYDRQNFGAGSNQLVWVARAID